MDIWEPYKNLLGVETVQQLFQIAGILKGAKIVHVNSTRMGGGVSEILNKMVPLMQGLGLNTEWHVIEGDEHFYQCTKAFHNLFQSYGTQLPSEALLRHYEEVNKKNSEKLAILQEADFVLIHDPQPLSLIQHFPKRKGKWVWRCHIDTSRAPRSIWKYTRPFIDQYDASVFSLENVNQALPHPMYIVAPSIDPLSEKNIELDSQEIENTISTFHVDTKRPIIVQVSRFDHFKDPQGVIKAFQMSKKYNPGIQLILAGGGANDDPEGEGVLREVKATAEHDPDIFILNLPPDAHRVINALQRRADIVLQKSVKEGFGLTVTEALWKMKPVIGGNTGGIRIQIIDHYTGLLVNTPEGAANRLRYLLRNPEIGKQLGISGKRYVKDNFLITRHLREYLSMFATLINPDHDRVDLSHKPEPPKL